MIESAARGAQFFLAIGIAYVVALWFALIAWTFRDIESRSRSVFTQVFSTLLVVLFFVPGLLLYLILRPKETLDQTFQRALEEEYLLQDLDELPLCRGCQRAIDPEYVLCPHCQTTLRHACQNCSKLIDVRWSVCPYCTTPVTTAVDAAVPALDGVRVMDESAAGRRRRAVAAAAQKTGIPPEELDAFTDALAESGRRAAVGAGNGSLPGRGERAEANSENNGIWSRLARFGASSATTGTPEAPTAPRGSESFWADPLPGSDVNRGRSTSDQDGA